NMGGLRALLGSSALGQNDYVTGFNIDLAALATSAFQDINVEGNGFGGIRDLMTDSFPFGQFHLVEVAASSSKVSVVIDGKDPGQSGPRQKQLLAMEELVVGARLFSNEPRPTFVQGFLNGDIAELLIFDRALSETESTRVRSYLQKRYQGISDVATRHDN